MKDVCYIHSYPGCATTLAMLWPGFRLMSIPLIGVECVGEPTRWPEPIKTIEAGINAYANVDNYNLPSRLVLTLKHFLTTEYDRCLIAEYDSLILGPMPDYPSGFTTHLAGGRLPGSEASHFYHSPWISDRDAAADIIRVGMELMMDGTVGRGPQGTHGAPDVFLGLIADRCGMKFNESGTVSYNTIESPEQIAVARKSIAEGCWFLHGVKTRQQMEAILA